MLLNGYDLGKCGIEQVLCAGNVSFYTKDVGKGVALIELPENIIITKAVAVVNTAFNAATTNVLTVGTNDSADDLLGADDVTEGRRTCLKSSRERNRRSKLSLHLPGQRQQQAKPKSI